MNLVYQDGGSTRGSNGRLSMEQKERHASLAAIGHTVEVVKASTADKAASMAVELVRRWLAGNNNEKSLVRLE